MNTIRFLFTACLILYSSTGFAAKHESVYRDSFCNAVKGQTEYRLPDNARVDCFSEQYAIEIEFAKKWAEGSGQSLYYAQMTRKKPSIGLILADGKEEIYLKSLTHVTDKHGIKIFIIKKDVE